MLYKILLVSDVLDYIAVLIYNPLNLASMNIQKL